ncbi:MAG: serine/threonine protein kinase [Myxococcales bacterium]|nr:MAG: serine/threonine protein kinase [Myxococcales bacterium]
MSHASKDSGHGNESSEVGKDSGRHVRQPTAAFAPMQVSASHAADPEGQTQLAVSVSEAKEGSWIGRVIDERYRILEVLGEGGMGKVFVAEHLKLHKRVAFKAILSGFIGNDEITARFAREAMASARLEHPHIASALDYGTLPEGGAYLVMQFVTGHSLGELFDRHETFSWRDACHIAAQVADAMISAHAAGIVHRDLKPDNIMIEKRDDDSWWVMVLDFGIAQVQSTGQPAPQGAVLDRSLTRVGTVVGTPGYMAPEQAMGGAVDVRADLYALGVILWEMLTGQRLFDGESFTEIVTKQLTHIPPSLNGLLSLRQPAPVAGLDQIVGALLKPKPEDRPESATQLRQTLRELGSQIPQQPSFSTATHAARSYVEHTTRGFAALLRAFGQRCFRVLPDRLQPYVSRWFAVFALASAVIVAMILWSSSSDTKTEVANAGIVSNIKDAFSHVPEEVKQHVETMMTHSRKVQRRQAARWLLDHKPVEEIPSYALAVAEFELAKQCRLQRQAIERIVETDERKALPALERVKKAPRSGCGFLGIEDCYKCIRKVVATAIKTLDD